MLCLCRHADACMPWQLPAADLSPSVSAMWLMALSRFTLPMPLGSSTVMDTSLWGWVGEGR